MTDLKVQPLVDQGSRFTEFTDDGSGVDFISLGDQDFSTLEVIE